MATLDKDHELILGILTARGTASSRDLQDVTGKSQPTISRLLAGLSTRVVALGRARAARYGVAKSIHGLASQQPIYWTFEDGSVRRIGTLTLLANDTVFVDSDFVDSASFSTLPWFLTPLQAQGFLGRLHAQRLAGLGIAADPQSWDLETTLFAAMHLHDAPGALTLGEPRETAHRQHALLPGDAALMPRALDDLAADVASTLPAGSSAGGEQPKFLAAVDSGRHVLVKFTPPKGTPFGDRWSDLLHAEALASRVLGRHGVPVAQATVIESRARTYLVSERFDRVGARGRRHVVSVGAAHSAFVPSSYSHWGLTCEMLQRQRRLSPEDAARATALLQFGRLIGNTDMHSGNLGLLVRPEDLAKGRFALAPVYDMLPMRWRPDAALGGAPDYTAFDPDPVSTSSPAATPAHAYWAELASLDRVSKPLRAVAKEMARRVTPKG